ncbi:MAG: DUF4388 domain-containing protein [Chloroflexi bacterium]|nr:DUF4388 domain-containing protein [Chloroflexota bacterium]
MAHLRLSALLRLMAGLGRTAAVTAEHGPWVLRVWFDQGRVIAAARSPESGLAALESAAYLFPSGQFAVSDDQLAVDRAVERTVNLTAVELARYLDEIAEQRAEVDALVPSLWAVPHVAEPASASTLPSVALDDDEAACLTIIDGRRAVAEILGTDHPVSRLRTLARLVKRGAVELSRDSAADSSWTASAAPDPDTDQSMAVEPSASTALPARMRAQ